MDKDPADSSHRAAGRSAAAGSAVKDQQGHEDGQQERAQGARDREPQPLAAECGGCGNVQGDPAALDRDYPQARQHVRGVALVVGELIDGERLPGGQGAQFPEELPLSFQLAQRDDARERDGDERSGKNQAA
jgi:hypothetical protein